jgi:hypothetical protein
MNKKQNRRIKMVSFRLSEIEYEKLQLLSKINRSAIIRQLLLNNPDVYGETTITNT